MYEPALSHEPIEPIYGENWPLVIDGPIEFKKLPVEGQGFRKITDHFREIYGTHLKTERSLHVNRLDLEMLDFVATCHPRWHMSAK